jgi:hypothetical protein
MLFRNSSTGIGQAPQWPLRRRRAEEILSAELGR